MEERYPIARLGEIRGDFTANQPAADDGPARPVASSQQLGTLSSKIDQIIQAVDDPVESFR